MPRDILARKKVTEKPSNELFSHVSSLEGYRPGSRRILFLGIDGTTAEGLAVNIELANQF